MRYFLLILFAAVCVCGRGMSATQCVTNQKALSVRQLYGKVFDQAGEPISGADVDVLDSDSRPIAHSQSDEKGIFQIGNVAAGKYILVIRAKDFQAARQDIVLRKPRASDHPHVSMQAVLTIGGCSDIGKHLVR